ncbi:MAG: ABC transporter ATP-binding protein [Chloroflexi bacterium]|nr:ABC transporter ATP-binding protein [Chloroflexota bacterium]
MRLLLRLLSFLRPYWRLTAGAYICVVLNAAFTLVVPWMLGQAVDRGIVLGDMSFVAKMGVFILAASVLRGLFAFGQGYLAEASAQGVSYQLRRALYGHVQRLSFSFHDQAQTGELMARATADVESVRAFTGRGLTQVANMVLLLLGVAIALFGMNWKLALLSMLLLPALAWRAYRFGREVRPMHRAVQDELATLANRIQETVAGIQVVKAFGRGQYEVERFDRQNERLYRRYVAAARATALNAPFLDLLSNGCTLLMLWLGGILVVWGQLSFGELVAFYAYLLQLVLPIRRGGWLMTMAARASASSERIFEILDTPVRVADRDGATVLPPLIGSVEFEDVSCSYYPGRPVLQQVSFRAEPGQTVALVGATGSGKTSIANLIPRFYDVDGGRVLVDGHDVRDVQIGSLRQQIGIVMQETLLFADTVRANIAFGRPGASDAEIRAAARAARADEFIERLPERYETPVGERGVSLSGGQKQRIAIARALLMNPRILILDEFTSSVDVATERLIRAALVELMRNRTTFVIAHRLSTVRAANQILVLEAGQLVAIGTHEQLLETTPLYRDTYALQLQSDDAASSTGEPDRAGQLPSPTNGIAGSTGHTATGAPVRVERAPS